MPLQGEDTLAVVQRSAAEWSRLRSEMSRLEADWKVERGVLEATLLALEERTAALERRRSLAEAETAEARAAVERLKAQHVAAAGGMTALAEGVGRLAAELKAVRPGLPPRLSRALELAYRSVEDNSLSAGERFQHALSILQRCLQFNKSVTFSEEILEGAAAEPDRVAEVIYWGLAEAYAVDRSRGKAYLGHPAPGGWVWEPRDDAAGSIAALIDVYKDAAEPRFIALPARLRHSVDGEEGR